MKKGEFWTFLLVGLAILISSLLVPGINQEARITFTLMAMMLILHAGRFLGYGRPQTYLPVGGEFCLSRISMEKYEDGYLFLTLGVRTGKIMVSGYEYIRLYKIKKDLLADSGGHPVSEIPQKFQVKIGWQIIEWNQSKKHPKTRKVYCIFPVS